MIRKTKRIRQALRAIVATLRGQMEAGESWMYQDSEEDDIEYSIPDQDIADAIEWIDQRADDE